MYYLRCRLRGPTMRNDRWRKPPAVSTSSQSDNGLGSPSRSRSRVGVESRDVLQEHARNTALIAEFDEVRALQRVPGKQDAVVSVDPSLEEVFGALFHPS